MKKIVQTVIIAAGLATPAAFGQGFIGFANVNAPIIDGATGSAALSSAGYSVGLYWGTSPSGDLSLAQNSKTGSSAITGLVPIPGTFNNAGQTVGIVGTNPGDVVYVQIRAWTGGFDSFEAAVAAGNAGDYVGMSEVLNPISLVGSTQPGPSLVIQGGLTSFTTSPVPEPSTIAFGILGGIGAMVLLRRRK